MKRIYAAILVSAVVLGGGLPAAHGQSQPRRFNFGFAGGPAAAKVNAAPAPVVSESNIELAAMESRTITVPAQVGPGSSTASQPAIQSVNCRSLVIDFELKGVGPSGVGTIELWYTRNGQIRASSPARRRRRVRSSWTSPRTACTASRWWPPTAWASARRRPAPAMHPCLGGR